jgi:hypothetical protein
VVLLFLDNLKPTLPLVVLLVLLAGLVWFGLVWFGLVWFGLVLIVLFLFFLDHLGPMSLSREYQNTTLYTKWRVKKKRMTFSHGTLYYFLCSRIVGYIYSKGHSGDAVKWGNRDGKNGRPKMYISSPQT